MNIFTLLAVVSLGAPFQDGAVLQRGMKVPVWGTAQAGEKVTVSFAGQTKTCTVAQDGKWRVDLDPLATSSEGRVLTANERTVKDVLVGEVWFASGQSNMECPIWDAMATRYRDRAGGMMIQMTELPLVRYFKVSHAWARTVKPVMKSGWKTLTSANLKRCAFSAVAFYYARELYLALQVPIGLVDASWGGTNIDAWTPHEAYATADPSLETVGRLPLLSEPEFWQSYSNGVYAAALKAGYRVYWHPHYQPSVIWNGMVGAFTPMAMRGFIWYQGCCNSGESQYYCAKMHALYDGWSKAFENPNLKLYFVQLAPFNQNWMGICEQQTKFATEEKNAELAVTADVGNFKDVHPNQKQIVAQRLALHALRRDYGFKGIGEDCSPVLKSVTFKDGKAILSFDHVKSWYIYHPDYIYTAPFQVAGRDGQWKSAKIVDAGPYDTRQMRGVLKGTTISLKSDDVAEPVHVRYMGEKETFGTLFNEASLPLGPFTR